MKKKVLSFSLLTMMVLGFAQNAAAADDNDKANSDALDKVSYYGTDEGGSYYLPKNRSDIQKRPEARDGLPTISATNTNTPTKSFVDISSHNGSLSVANFQEMKKYGVTGVVIKLTEATSYVNPYAQTQVNNAKAAGMKVSAYHYSWFTTPAQAQAEADYFANAAARFGLDKSTVMVNDIEEPNIAGANHTANSQAFAARLNQLGYGTVQHYTSTGWLNSGLLNGNALGKKNIWAASYYYSVNANNLHTEYGSWQWSPQLTFPGISGIFDISADYAGTFTKKKVTVPNEPSQAGAQPVYRLYNPNSSEHFYTEFHDEAQRLADAGWDYEGKGWDAPNDGVPVYRFYNPNSGDHHYTTVASEKDFLIKMGWKYECVSWQSGGSRPLYRLYNKNAKGAGSHHFTLNDSEKNAMIKAGWTDEGYAWNSK